MENISREPPKLHRRDGSVHHSFGDISGAVRPGHHRSWAACSALLQHHSDSFNPTALWVVQQLREAFPFDTAPRYLIFDRDSTFSTHVIATIKSFGIKPARTSWHSPWQNGVVERWIGSCRRELLDHIIVFNERHATRLLSEYIGYYNADRCHYGLGKDAPESRPVQHKPSNQARVVAMARVGGLHHRYEWKDAA